MKKTKPTLTSPNVWATRWLDSVASSANTMSQRKLTSIEARGGGIKSVSKLAKQRGVHLLRLTDDSDTELVAASKRPFKIIC